jgi:hypothetical protein
VDEYVAILKSHPKSCHFSRLAIHCFLFRDRIYLHNSDDYEFLGDLWKPLDPRCRWGGDFTNPDGVHFSFEHEGIS